MFKYEKYKTCDNEYRSAPFWSWNDKLEKDELIRQIHEMHEQGIGGFFMHPRGGLADEYLGESFMEAVKACVEEAEKLGMKAWLYDEDRFPSGYAAGMVTKENPDYAAGVLEMEKLPSTQLKNDGDIVKAYLCCGEGSFKQIDKPAGPDISDAERDIVIFRIKKVSRHPGFDNQPYTDLCNKEAVDAFIRITYEAYKKTVGMYFGTVIPGIFTDEPSFYPGERGRYRLPWPAGFDAEFRRKKGYDIMEHFPELFFDTGNYRKTRFDFWDVLSAMFVEAFTKNIYEWCEENGLQFTGHFWEHVFPNPLYTGSVMPNYEFMQVPGIDMLFNTEEEREQFGNVLIVKEVSSVANQLGRERVMSETYGASGWELNFADQKRVADWQFSLGINLVCQHLVLYSLKGYRKRDFPLSFMDHQPWWKYYRILGDYIGRLSYIMSQGDFVGDVLVLHPASSTWAEFSPNKQGNSLLEEIEKSVKSLVKTLCEIQCPFDLGDDVIIQRHGRVVGDRFIIGKMAYRTVIVPSMTVMRSSSYELLRQFAQGGGRIIVTGITPSYLDGQESQELREFFKSNLVVRIAPGRQSLKKALNDMGNTLIHIEDISGKEPHNIYCHVRKCNGTKVIFLCNISREESYNVRLRLDGQHYIEEWDPVSGEKSVLVPYEHDGGIYIDLVFEPVGSHLLVINADMKGLLSYERPGSGKSVDLINLSEWSGRRTEYNALTINRCSISLDGGAWEAEDNVLLIDDELKDRLGFERAHIFSRQPWMYSCEERNRVYSVKAKYVFYTGERISGEVFAAIESPDVFNVYVNGREVRPTGRTYKDRAFVMYDIKEALLPGRNEIILDTDKYGQLVSLESIYIVGDFKLAKDSRGFVLHNEDGDIMPGDWTLLGYPYYSGSVRYSAEFEIAVDGDDSRVEIELGDFWGAVSRVIVNGNEASILGWKPYRVDITKYIQDGRNSVEVEVVNSLQNLLGPHHYLPMEGLVTPGSFYCKEDVKFDKSGFSGEAVIRVYKGE